MIQSSMVLADKAHNSSFPGLLLSILGMQTVYELLVALLLFLRVEFLLQFIEELYY